jgi:hypothetical protein
LHESLKTDQIYHILHVSQELRKDYADWQSKPIVEFLNRSDNDYSLSGDKDNVKILAMIANTFFLLYIRHLGVGKLLLGEINELVNVPRMATAAAQGEAVSIRELKIAIVKGLEILISKSDAEPQTSKDDIVKI